MSQHLSKPLYGNCLILAPDGQPLCRTNEKKLKWYLDRKLATIEKNQSSLTIRLLFEPAGRKGANHPYLIAEKKNRCVACGSEHEITRHHVVPYGFRKFFPLELKEHMLHDILPLCVECHEAYEHSASTLKKELSVKYNMPLTGKGCYTNKSLYSIRGAGKALKYAWDKIPASRREVLLNKLRSYYNKQDITLEDIEKASKVEAQTQTPEYIPFAKYVVDNCNIQEFVVMWRKHFIETLKPQYLPDFWDINHPVQE
jgi:hypothetical protein